MKSLFVVVARQPCRPTQMLVLVPEDRQEGGAGNGQMHGCNRCQRSICWDAAAAIPLHLQVEALSALCKAFRDIHCTVLMDHLLLAIKGSSVLMIQACLLAGFGSVCTLATLIWPFFEGVAVMGVIFPLFVMVACEADPRLALQRCECLCLLHVSALHPQSIPSIPAGLKIACASASSAQPYRDLKSVQSSRNPDDNLGSKERSLAYLDDVPCQSKLQPQS